MNYTGLHVSSLSKQQLTTAQERTGSKKTSVSVSNSFLNHTSMNGLFSREKELFSTAAGELGPHPGHLHQN